MQQRFDTRRLIDIVVSASLIVLLMPVLLLITLLIVVTDPGPPIYSHRRVGLGGKSYGCLKFRSMCTGAERRLDQLLAKDPVLREEWLRDFKLANDPRVTRVGRFLRHTSLDELMQLFNVLAGSMSLVGPRPIVREELKRYGRFADHYMSVKPGLTGLWQVSGRSSVSYRRRVAADVLYVRSRSYALDMRILFMTVPAVLLARGSC
ncbi:sugar transferase [Novosphingobium malaysiense]|uniref:Bacterial sugar transferase domain-containing protein n=1 Tax=Novosphingobium malaysiense TaxID=1348853 RepID=A0A0B1ZWQ1_9SPHN|nr:sugar transferase [Novosphingobium malaysiense]KHK93593.1 hypothetical protein LK12_00225 [Novosphingobium malaysiense]